MIKKRVLITWILVLFSLPAPAQDEEIVKLKESLIEARADTSKLSTLIKLCTKLYRKNSSEAIKYGNEAKALAEKLDDQNGVATALKYIGLSYYFQGDYPETINSWQQSLTIFERLNDKLGVANLLNNLGAVYNNVGDDARALDLYLESLEISEEINDTLRIVTAMINIGLIYQKKAETQDKALEYYLRSLPLSEDLNDQDALGTTAVNLGEIYFDRGDYSTALFYFEMSRNSFEISNTGNVPYSLTSIGKVHAKRGDYQNAIKYQEQAFQLASEMDAKLDMVQSLLGLADTYRDMGNKQLSRNCFKQAEPIAIEVGALYELKRVYEGLAFCYAEFNEYKNAFKYQELLTSINDTIYSETTQKQINQLLIQYETKVIERENEILKRDVELTEAKNNLQRLIIYLFILLFVLIVVSGIFLIRAYYQKRKTNRELSEKNALITEQQIEITSSIQYASRIQDAMLTPGPYISELDLERFIFFRPRDIVSGDFYWFSEKNDKIICAIADCTGHGVPGAFMSMLGISLLNQIVGKQKDIHADKILEELRTHVIKSLRQTGKSGEIQDGIDIVLLILDIGKKSLEYAGANNPLIIIRKGELIEYKADMMPIGIQINPGKHFSTTHIDLQDEDILYAFSDGYIDQFGGPDHKKFMSKNFKKLLIDIHQKPMEEQKQILSTTLDDWMAETKQVDDILVVGIRI